MDIHLPLHLHQGFLSSLPLLNKVDMKSHLGPAIARQSVEDELPEEEQIADLDLLRFAMAARLVRGLRFGKC